MIVRGDRWSACRTRYQHDSSATSPRLLHRGFVEDYGNHLQLPCGFGSEHSQLFNDSSQYENVFVMIFGSYAAAEGVMYTAYSCVM